MHTPFLEGGKDVSKGRMGAELGNFSTFAQQGWILKICLQLLKKTSQNLALFCKLHRLPVAVGL